jgi:hypothetical protein
MKGTCMNTQLRNFDIFPRIVRENTKTTITIKPLGDHAKKKIGGKKFTVVILPQTENESLMSSSKSKKYVLESNKDGCLVIENHPFGSEQEYLIKIYDFEFEGLYKDLDYVRKINPMLKFAVYALAEDLFELRPYKGDMHIHTYRSDGRETPAIVAATYRKSGYDFISITDHHEYNGSIEAIKAYKDAPIDFVVIPGEEVHTPDNDIHLISLGADYSITDIYKKNPEKYRADVNEIMETLDIDEDINKFAFAACLWAFNKIKEANGLRLFVHPHWEVDTYHVPDKFTKELFKTGAIDAFEILSGVSKLPTNERQLALYNDLRLQGYDIPFVGSSDCHGCLNYMFDTTKSIVFAKSCKKEDIKTAITNKYTVAVDTYEGNDYRIHGSYRLSVYARFLMENYYPEHDELCFEEGIQMKRYALGIEDSVKHLEILKGRTSEFLKHCFAK